VNFGTFGDVRMLVALMTFFTGVGAAFGQEQERKLIDRLLKPNTSLVNPAQDKKFVAPEVVSIDKRAPARTFYSPQRISTKTLSSDQAFTPQQFAARHFRTGDSAANLSTRSRLTTNDKIISPPPAPGVWVAPENTASSPVRDFPGARPFLAQGKSQKALQARNAPLTIEQVRELLNKSK
jgi:hypothetical protein